MTHHRLPDTRRQRAARTLLALLGLAALALAGGTLGYQGAALADNPRPVFSGEGIGWPGTAPLARAIVAAPERAVPSTPPSGPACASCHGPKVRPAAPVHTDTIAVLAQFTQTACDPTGHCARLKVAVQRQDGVQVRGYAVITCFSGSGDFACAGLTGSVQLNCTLPGGTDCTRFSAQVSCGRLVGPNNPGPASCANPTFALTPWYRWPTGQNPIVNAASGWSFVTGAAGGGTGQVQTATGITGV